MSIHMFVVAVFLLAGEPRTIRLEAPSVTTCIADTLTVEATLTALGAQVATTFCMIEVHR